MTTIQRYPSGLVSALDIKDRNPPGELADLLQAQIDVSQFYLLQTLQDTFAVGNGVVATGITATLTVPDSEAWLIRQIGYSIAFNTTNTTVRGAIRYVRTPASIAVVLTDSVQNTVNAAQPSIAVAYRGPLLLPPGSSVHGLLTSLSPAATVDTSIQAIFNRFAV